MTDDTYKKRAAKLEAYRRGRFYWWDKEDVRSRYEVFLSSEDLMEGQLSKHMQRQFLRYGTRLETPTFPLVSSLARDKAVAFREGMTVELLDDSGMAVSSERVPIVQHLHRLIHSTGLWAAMARADSYLVSHRSAAVWMRLTSSGKLLCSCLPPYCIDVEPGEEPNNPDRAFRIVVPQRGDAYPVDVSRERRVSYECLDGWFYAGLVDVNGDPIEVDLPEAPDGQLLVQAHPVVIWTEEDSDSVLAPLPKALLHSQETVNLLLAETQLAFRAGAHGQPYLKRGANANPFGDQATPERVLRVETSTTDVETLPKIGNQNVALQGGVDSIPVIGEGWELALLQARVDALDHLRYVEGHIKLGYAGEGMVVTRIDIFNPQPSNYSASSKMMDAAPLEDERQRREMRLARDAERTLEVWRGYWNLVAAPELRIPEELSFRVHFPGAWSPGVLTDQSFQQGLQLAFENGLADPADVVASLEGISRREAAMRVAARQRKAARAALEMPSKARPWGTAYTEPGDTDPTT